MKKILRQGIVIGVVIVSMFLALNRQIVWNTPDSILAPFWVWILYMLGGILVFGLIGYGILQRSDLKKAEKLAGDLQTSNLALQEASERIEAKSRKLAAINRVGQRLASEIRRTESGILELIYEQAGSVMDASNMFINLYDEQSNTLHFPLMSLGGQLLANEKLPPNRQLNLDDESKGALTELVIRYKTSLRIDNVPEWYQQQHLSLPYPPTPKSWMGVPMLLEGKLLGIIALWNVDRQNAYSADDLEVLEIMAGQAAVALENARLYASEEKRTQELERANKQLQEAQEKIAATEGLRTLSRVSGELAHKMNNLAGPIPVRIEMIKDLLSPDNPHFEEIASYLDHLHDNSLHLISMAKEIRRTTRTSGKIEVVALPPLLDQAWQAIKRSRPDIEGRIRIECDIENALPAALLEKERLGNLFDNLLNNAIDAMPDGGTLTISGRRIEIRDRPHAEIAIKDTGIGIPPQDMESIFHLFYTTKERGLGFGLWRDKAFLEEINGKIDVASEVGKGSTFTITIPGEHRPHEER